ncbi:uncharacterized protein [Dysidea avara]|uniref:uncharacterized protein n=1 Tax=Dysidea avara TaxID=196820 RepID=UPI0033184B42
MKYLLLLTTVLVALVVTGHCYYIGVSQYDITGPAAEINMMGYASLDQVTAGIHFRLWCRTFIIANSLSGPRVVLVTLDTQAASQIMKIEVVRNLQATYGNLYTDDNVLLSGTHTHSGPGGYWQYVLFEVTSLGFVKESLDVIVDGVVESIKIAHNNMKKGSLLTSSGSLTNSSINRSPFAYEQNLDKNDYPTDVDYTMFLLKLVSETNQPLGSISWFPVHTTSMNNTNDLISGDNKGYASYLMEQHMNNGALPGKGSFVAAFPQSHSGDVSPNTAGARCIDTGLPCDYETSTCNGEAELCIAFGPGVDMVDSTRIIGENQYYFARTLLGNASNSLSGPVDSRHAYVDMTSLTVNLEDGTQVKTCPPAMGRSFAAGTTDGPGTLGFSQADTGTNAFWDLVRGLLSAPTPQQEECHAPKPILLNTGGVDIPYEWQPSIVPVQIVRVGQLYVLAAPGEFTTMAGRRLINSVKKTLRDNGVTGDIHVVISALANTYVDYITTIEEYNVQRYEGASTIYGPHTLSAFIQEFNKLAAALAQGVPVSPGPSPPNYLDEQISLVTPVVLDGVPFLTSFGDVISNAHSSYSRGSTVFVSFWAGHPRNNFMTGKTFLEVQKKKLNGAWEVLYTDASWETRFRWVRTLVALGQSRVEIEWDIPSNAAKGTYRIKHFGHRKRVNFFGSRILSYSGVSRQFQVY